MSRIAELRHIPELAERIAHASRINGSSPRPVAYRIEYETYPTCNPPPCWCCGEPGAQPDRRDDWICIGCLFTEYT